MNIDAIRAICASVDIPIYANGGVTCARDALDFLRQTGAAGVSIGRAALKQPWIFDDISRLRRGEEAPARRAPERIDVLLRLATLACGHRPERVAICEMRKFSGWLLPGLTGASEVLRRMNSVETLESYQALLEGFLESLVRRNDLEIHSELLPVQTLDTVDGR